MCVCHPTTSNALNGKLYSTMLYITYLTLKKPFLHLSVKWSGNFVTFPWTSWELGDAGRIAQPIKKTAGISLVKEETTYSSGILENLHSRCHSSQILWQFFIPRKTGWQTEKSAETARGWRILACQKNASTCYVLKLGKVLIMILVSKTVTISQNQNQYRVSEYHLGVCNESLRNITKKNGWLPSWCLIQDIQLKTRSIVRCCSTYFVQWF